LLAISNQKRGERGGEKGILMLAGRKKIKGKGKGPFVRKGARLRGGGKEKYKEWKQSGFAARANEGRGRRDYIPYLMKAEVSLLRRKGGRNDYNNGNVILLGKRKKVATSCYEIRGGKWKSEGCL